MKNTTKKIVKSYAKSAGYAALSVAGLLATGFSANTYIGISKKSAQRAVEFGKDKRIGASVMNALAAVEMGVFTLGTIATGIALTGKIADRMEELATERDGLRAGMKAAEDSIESDEEVQFDD